MFLSIKALAKTRKQQYIPLTALKRLKIQCHKTLIFYFSQHSSYQGSCLVYSRFFKKVFYYHPDIEHAHREVKDRKSFTLPT
jgi:hypothetical protein